MIRNMQTTLGQVLISPRLSKCRLKCGVTFCLHLKLLSQKTAKLLDD